MKFSTVMAVFAVVLSCAFCGCKYDKARGGSGAGDSSALGSDINSELAGDEGLLGGADGMGGAGQLPFEDTCDRCTDVSFDAVYFTLDSIVIPDGEVAKIDAVAQHLKDRDNRVVVIEGNCDERGSNEYNMSLGENRAIIIRNYLVQNGITADRIQTRSFGEEKPAADGHDESAWAKNRRGEFVIFQKR